MINNRSWFDKHENALLTILILLSLSIILSSDGIWFRIFGIMLWTIHTLFLADMTDKRKKLIYEYQDLMDEFLNRNTHTGE